MKKHIASHYIDANGAASTTAQLLREDDRAVATVTLHGESERSLFVEGLHERERSGFLTWAREMHRALP